uniref:Protein-lysine N-methyltransferase SMYD4 n=1 Tax=Ficedula albicollis TaxID=59894 RepID=U3JVT0_FICAL
ALDPALRERLAAASLHDAVRLGCELSREGIPKEGILQALLRGSWEGSPEAAAGLWSLQAASHQLPGSPEVSVCFANRSAALLHLGHFEACLEDIARAERHGYPDRLLPKVLLRKAECLLCLERLQDAQDILRVLESKIALDGVMTAHLTRLKKLSQLKVKLGEKERCPEPALEAHGGIQGEPEIWEENSSISGASSSLSLSFDAERGRHLVASQDIVPGQSLVKEEAFVSVLCPGESLPLQDGDTAWDTRATNADLYCHRCLRQLLASVPCQGCSYAKYCSQGCADMAWQQYHRTECSLGALLLTLGVFCHLALRTVLLAGFAEVSRLVAWSHHGDKNLRSPEARCKPLSEAAAAGAGSRGIPGCGSNGRYQSSYQALFHLLPHTEQHSPEHKFLCTLSVVAICKQLQAAGLEAAALNQESPQQRSKPKACGKTSDELSPELKTVAEAMLRHVLQLQCNAQAITVMQELGPGDGAVVDKKPVRLATAFFPVLSLLNHSCRPNTSVSFSGTAATVRASQPISSGQEVLHCYGEPEIWEENSSISGASSSLSLSFDAERGRHLVASQDIVPGQSLVKEEAFVSVLCPGESLPLQDGDTAWDTQATNADLYCHRCLRQLLASVPCQGCSYAKYCSQGCADMAWQQYHRTECSLGALLLTLGVFCHLALRTVLLAGFAEVSRLVAWSHHGDKNLRSPEARCKPLSEAAAAGAGSRGIPGCGSNGRYQSSYQALFHLLPHTEQHSPEHKFLCTLSVVAICKQLQAAGLEAAALNQESPQQRSKPKACGKTSDELSPELKTVAEAMLRHVLQLQCNAQAITVMQELGKI